MKGLEPILLTEPDPKSGAATNYAISAWFSVLLSLKRFGKRECKDTLFFSYFDIFCFVLFAMGRNAVVKMT